MYNQNIRPHERNCTTTATLGHAFEPTLEQSVVGVLRSDFGGKCWAVRVFVVSGIECERQKTTLTNIRPHARACSHMSTTFLRAARCIRYPPAGTRQHIMRL